MKKQSQVSKIQEIKAKRDQLLAQLQRLQGQSRSVANKAEARKRFLVGELVLAEAAKRPWINRWLRRQFQKSLKKAKDRSLFELPPIDESEVNQVADLPKSKKANQVGQADLVLSS